ncbi:hypothetical protein [Bradyrhizobium sp. CCBAU 45384]|uniref:hypothetical protein n=1 Tax=Bradyrhizobium sp. CCBAU 45384 TaxID=858428 RepID=UPI003FA41114
MHDEPRSGAPRTIGDASIEAVVVRTLESCPENGTHWSSRGMAKASGLSRRCNASGGPSGCSRADWTRPSSRQIRICDQGARRRRPLRLATRARHRSVLDEKSQIQALDWSQPMLPMRPGQPAEGAMTTRGTAPNRCSKPSTLRPEGHRKVLRTLPAPPSCASS